MNTSLLLFLLSLNAAVLAAPPERPVKQTGTASWYGAECSKTANGTHYNPESLTAAHRTLPFGTLVEVHNLGNGRSVTVRITDRGPFCKRRIIDVSKGAAKELQMIGSGTAKVELIVLQ